MISKNYKILIISFLSISTLLLSSCGGDDEGPAYEFLDQNLQGQIEGNAFNFGEGIVEFDDEEDEMSFDFYSDMETDVTCGFFFGEFSRAFFSMAIEEGVTELFADFNSGDSQSITLFEPPGNNIICLDGAIEILSITDTEVTGKIDARFDDENYINGNFTVSVCAP